MICFIDSINVTLLLQTRLDRCSSIQTVLFNKEIQDGMCRDETDNLILALLLFVAVSLQSSIYSQCYYLSILTCSVSFHL